MIFNGDNFPKCSLAFVQDEAFGSQFRFRSNGYNPLIIWKFEVCDGLWKTLSREHWRRNKSRCLLTAKDSLFRNIFFRRTNSARPKPSFNNLFILSFSSLIKNINLF